MDLKLDLDLELEPDLGLELDLYLDLEPDLEPELDLEPDLDLEEAETRRMQNVYILGCRRVVTIDRCFQRTDRISTAVLTVVLKTPTP